jgi:peptidoglycan/LPS O-acetylase OafA/YrhL
LALADKHWSARVNRHHLILYALVNDYEFVLGFTVMSDVERDYFRRDIQGLRGIAVLLVVVYHSGVGLPGGFIGVDVFFVISGFVISQLLLRELRQTGTARLRDFYVRRARRLLPALALVTIVTLAFSILFLSPFGNQQEVVRTSQATTLFLANAYLFLENTYFSLADNPFRHMWSLAIEEQFYLLLPAALMIGWKLTKRFGEKRQLVALGVGVIVVSLVSFAIGVALSFGYRLTPLPERFAFFGLPSRIWEFGVGVLLAIAPLQSRMIKKYSAVILLASSSAIIWSALRLESFTPFPGYVALAPVLGTGGLIAVGQNSARISKILAWRPLATLGDLSYGWYLWHWPFTVYCLTIWPSNSGLALVAGFASLIPTVISYRLLEQPIRHNNQISGSRAIRLVAICVVVPLGFGLIVERIANTHLGLSQPEVALRAGIADDCGFTVESNQWREEQCTFRVENSKGKIFLFGDSQARAFADGVIKSGNELGYDVAVLATAGCPMATRAPLGVSWCEAIQTRLLELIDGCDYKKVMTWRSTWCKGEKTSRPVLVIIGNSVTRYMGDEYRLPSNDGSLPQDTEGRASSIVTAIHEVIAKISDQNVRTLLIHEAPSVLMDADVSLLQPKSQIKARGYSEQSSRNKVVDALERVLADGVLTATFDPASIVCDRDQCEPVKNGEIIYYDSSHLNAKGSEMLSEELTKKIRALIG